MKIGLLGAESTHAAHFCETVNRLILSPTCLEMIIIKWSRSWQNVTI